MHYAFGMVLLRYCVSMITTTTITERITMNDVRENRMHVIGKTFPASQSRLGHIYNNILNANIINGAICTKVRKIARLFDHYFITSYDGVITVVYLLYYLDTKEKRPFINPVSSGYYRVTACYTL